MMVSYNIYKEMEKEKEIKLQNEKDLKMKLLDITKDVVKGQKHHLPPTVQVVVEPLLDLGSDKVKEFIESS